MAERFWLICKTWHEKSAGEHCGIIHAISKARGEPLSLRLKMFLIFGGLIATLMLAQWLLFRSLTKEVSREFSEMAVSVGRGMMSVMFTDDASNNTFIELKQPHSPESDDPKQSSQQSFQFTHEITRFHTEVDTNKDELLCPPEKKVGIWVKKIQKGAGDKAFVTEQVYDDISQIPQAMKEMHWSSNDETQIEVIGVNDLHFKVDSPADNAFLIMEADGYQSRIPLPKGGVEQSLQRTSSFMIGGSLLLLLVGLLVAGYLAHHIGKPLADLSDAAEAIGQGAWGRQVLDSGGSVEISRAIEAFNGMSLRLQELDQAARRNQDRRHLAELGDIARGLAHTIRNPLNTLGLSLEQLAGLASARQESQVLVNASQKQIRRIDQWIRSFLALASEGKGRVEALDIAGLIQDVALEVLQDNLGKVRLDLDLETQLPPINGVAPELRAVLHALAVNAVEASPKGETVRFSARLTPEASILIEVCDQGSGVPQEIRDRLFTPHVTTKTHGSGMGLFLAHRLATGRYRGQLSLCDVPQGGTRAVLILPKDNEYHVED